VEFRSTGSGSKGRIKVSASARYTYSNDGVVQLMKLSLGNKKSLLKSNRILSVNCT